LLIDKEKDLDAARLVKTGPYFTNGIDLFRLVTLTSGSGGPKLVELEDCRTLEISIYAGDAVMTLGLRGVRPRRPTGIRYDGGRRSPV
jgi:hypothetical protein